MTLKILKIIDYYSPVWGGAQNQMTQLALRLKDHGCEITILTRRWDQTMTPVDQAFGFPVYRVGIPGQGFWPTICYVMGLFRFALSHRGSFHIVHTHGAAALGAVGKIMSVLCGAKNVAKVSSSLRIPQLQKKTFGFLVLNIFKRSDAITGLSEQIRQQLVAIGTSPLRIKLLSNGIDTTRFHPLNPEDKKFLRTQLGFHSEDLICLYTGRIIAGKGLEYLIELWPRLLQDNPKAKLALVGSGKYGISYFPRDSIEEQLKDTITRQHIPHVFLLGETPHPEQYFQIADIFVFPSRSEGVSNVLLEAMSSALGIIASDIGGNRELIRQDENGMLVPYGDSESLLNALNRLLADTDKRCQMGILARRTVEDRFDFRIIAQKYMETYKALTHGST